MINMLFFRNSIFFTSILVLFMSISCKSVEASFPDIDKPEIEEIKPVESVINIVMEVNLAPFLKTAEINTPKVFSGNTSQCEGVSYDYNFRRDNIQFSTSKKAINYVLNGDFSLELNYCPLCVTLWNGKSSCTVPRLYGSCGIDEPRLKYSLGYKTSLHLNKNYTLGSNTQLNYFKIIDPCEITFANYDVTDRVKTEIKKELIALEKNIDKEIKGIEMKSKINEAWEALKTPISLNSYGFLYLDPRGFALSSIRYRNQKALFSLNVFFSPLISTEPMSFSEKPLQEMIKFEEMNGFDIITDVRASYDSLSSILTKEFYNTEIIVKGRPVVIKEVNLIGTQASRLVISMKFEGFRKGTIYLVGTPEINIEKQTIGFNNVDFDIKTKNLLLKTSQWLMSKKIINEIQDKAIIDMSSSIDFIKKSLENELSKEIVEGIRAESSIDDIKIIMLLLATDYLALRSNLKGDLKILID